MASDKEELRQQDIELITKIRNGDEEAFAQLCAKYHPFVMWICFKKFIGKEDTDDLSQEIFMKIIANIDKLDGNTFQAWLYKVTVNHIYNFIDRRSKEKQVISESYELGNIHNVRENGTFQNVVDREKKKKVQEAVESIENEKFRLAMKTSMSGIPNKDIAVVMGVNSQRVSEYIYAAKQIIWEKLRRLL